VVLLGLQGLERREQFGLACERALAADPVDCTVARRCDDPGDWVVRLSVTRPPLERCRERVLHRVLGELEVAEDANEDRHRQAPLLAEQAAHRPSPTTGRISTEPLPATGTRCASSIAWSRSLQSARK